MSESWVNRTVAGIASLILAMAVSSRPARGQLVRALPPAGGAAESYAQSVNASGIVVGYTSDNLNDAATVWRPVLGEYVPELLPIIPGNPSGCANSIGSGGTIAGYAQPQDMHTATAVAWTSSAGSYSANPLPSPPGAVLTSAYAVNGAGKAVGFATNAAGYSAALAWTPDATGYPQATLLSSLPNQTESVATAVNDDGDVAGYAWLQSGSSATLASVVWLDGSKPRMVIAADLAIVTAMNRYGTGAGVYAGYRPLVMAYYEGDFFATTLPMPPTAYDGASNAVNNLDAIVGNVKDPDTATPGPEAYLWLPGETFWSYVNLDRWLNDVDPPLGARWTLSDALSLSDTWLVAGNGQYDPDGLGPLPAVPRGFVLDVSSLVPEPASSSAAVFLAARLLLGRRRRPSAKPDLIESR